ncbi:hypothetical protein LSCM1_05642 [Leishmania martiniquensis]|uniref:Uncharacterized protein n=1 Tax=Leishmania martiniquensis TaxID=1580590 RepID=A0A836GH31_9TRYP|nr:hypothetical protein LSCM1_05642 [Leishmania martiniquensis]
MWRQSVRQLAFMSPLDLYALSQRSSFSSYTQYDDACALARSYQRCSPAEKLKYEERVEAINDEMERTCQAEAQLLMRENDEQHPCTKNLAFGRE